MFQAKYRPLSVDGSYEPERLYREVRKMAVQHTTKRIEQIKSESFDLSSLEEQASEVIEEYRRSYGDSSTVSGEYEDVNAAATAVFAKDVSDKSSPEFIALKKLLVDKYRSSLVTELEEAVREFRAPSLMMTPHWYYAYLPEFCGSDMPWQTGEYGLQDPSKSYFTPWTPRTFLAPFAILPHHIEISFKTCTAVYLRDPVTRDGHTEVISPLPLIFHEEAYRFYVRRRK